MVSLFEEYLMKKTDVIIHFYSGLKSKKGIDGKFGLYDGSQFVYQEGKWSALNLMSLLWRYGFSLVKVNSMIGDMLDKFDR